jgi:hypothetical protein
MSVSGRFDIEIGITDFVVRNNKTIEKRIALSSLAANVTGKVAIFSGTVGITAISLSQTYRNAEGQQVTFGDRGDGRGGMNRVALLTQGITRVSLSAGSQEIMSENGRVAVTDSNADGSVSIRTEVGTSDYQVLIWADGD